MHDPILSSLQVSLPNWCWIFLPLLSMEVFTLELAQGQIVASVMPSRDVFGLSSRAGAALLTIGLG